MSIPAGYSALVASVYPVKEAGCRFHVTLQHAIFAGAALLAVLAGIGVTTIDYPAPTEAARARPSDLPMAAHEPAAVVAAVVEPPPADVAPEPPAPAPAPGLVPLSAAKGARGPAKTHARHALAAKKNKAHHAKRLLRNSAAMISASIDQQYDKAIKKECRCGVLGLLCRENVRWRLCNGRWHDGGNAAATRCYVRKTAAILP